MAEAAPQQSIRMIFGALFLVLLLAALDQTIVSTALPTIVGELGGLTHLSWVVTSYLLSSTVVTPLYGKFGDLHGRKIVLQVAIAIFLVGSALCGIAQDMLQLILFRALQGIVSALCLLGSFQPRLCLWSHWNVASLKVRKQPAPACDVRCSGNCITK